MLRYFLIACLVAFVPNDSHANPTIEVKENDFLDLVDGEGNVLIQARGVEAVNAEARNQGLKFPALGYWSPEGHCFVKPAPGDCNSVLSAESNSEARHNREHDPNNGSSIRVDQKVIMTK